MTRNWDTDTASHTGDWIMGAARRNPEALLLVAAGAVLLMRGGGKASCASLCEQPGQRGECTTSLDRPRTDSRARPRARLQAPKIGSALMPRI